MRMTEERNKEKEIALVPPGLHLLAPHLDHRDGHVDADFEVEELSFNRDYSVKIS